MVLKITTGSKELDKLIGGNYMDKNCEIHYI